MKHISAFIATAFAVILLNGCISSSRPPSDVFAPLTPGTAPEQVIAWPVLPVVKLEDGQHNDLHGQFGDAAPIVRAFFQANLDDFHTFQRQNKRNPNAPRPDFHRHLPLVLGATNIQTLTPLQKKNLDNLFLMHSLCCQMNDVFFLLATPHESVDKLQNAIKAATELRNFMASSPKLAIPAVANRLADDGDPLGTEWIQLFDGMTPLSSVPDKWTIATPKAVAAPCPYGCPLPVDAASKDQTLTLSVQTELPHDSKTTIFLIAQGLPSECNITLDGTPLTVEVRKSSAKITIPPEQITGKPQSLAISWKCSLRESTRIFRQPWFVMKN